MDKHSHRMDGLNEMPQKKQITTVDFIDLSVITPKIMEIAKKAGTYIRQELDQLLESHIETKEENSLVSYVDQNAEKLIVEGLSSLIEDAGFITEEATIDQSQTKYWTWVIDPLDGTTNYIHKIPVFAVSIGLLKDGIPVAGVIYHIMADECFYAWQGGGAWLNGQRIYVSKTSEIKDAVIATGFPYKRENIEELVLTLKKMILIARGIRRLGSAAIDLAYTACGRFDAYYEGSINAWDVSAGIIIVREAGGIVTGLYGEEEPCFTGHILAANPSIHSALRLIIKK
ncbi:MAG: inositol monophosphatase [Saprospiraceae bacterium]|nr:inositol monophosphatase [Saprospiraceae bacterium]